ncbi:MAG: YhcH/YjgK/YiaL family protein [Nitrospirae bacterium]|nr:YhcH/YjgK/YiaL family protein [Nitrospirota bacterium]
MILDTFDNAGLYFSHAWWRDLMAFLRSASVQLSDGEHPLASHGIVARVFSTQTRPQSSAQLESHRASVDVQVVLSGEELIAVWPSPTLGIRTDYDPTRDVMFYDPPTAAPVSFPLQPGRFAVFFPQDAHMTLIAPSAPAPMKKLVAKVPAHLFGA